MSDRRKTNDGFVPPVTPQPPTNNRPTRKHESGYVPPSPPVQPQPAPKKK